MPLVQNIILDWSGTLVDDLDCVVEAGNRLFSIYGKPPFTREEFRQRFFLPLRDFYATHLPGVSLEELDGHYHRFFREVCHRIQPFPQAQPFLESCRSKGLQLFLLSTIHPEHYRALAERFGLRGYFTAAVTAVQDKRSGLTDLLARHGLHPQHTLLVGDMVHDVEAAQVSGVRSCAVLTGYDTEHKLRLAKPDFLCRDLSEVEDLLS
jgi:phosphoglycolate phosphatase